MTMASWTRGVSRGVSRGTRAPGRANEPLRRHRSSALRLIATTCAVATLGVTAACSGGSDAVPGGSGQQSMLDRAPVATAEEIAQSPTALAIKQRGQIIIGSPQDSPLLSQQNPTTGQTEGFDATLGRLLAKYILGQPNVRIVNSVSQIREALLQNSTVDVVLHTYTINPVRAEKVSFAGPYFISGPAILTIKGSSGITKPQDLAGKKVIAVTNSTGSTLVEQYNPKEVITFASNSECVQALEDGRGDAYVNDLTLLAGAAKLDDKVQVSSGSFGQDPYGIGISHGDDAFKRFVNDWLKKIEDQGLWAQAYQESLGTVIPGDVPAPPVIGSVAGS